MAEVLPFLNEPSKLSRRHGFGHADSLRAILGKIRGLMLFQLSMGNVPSLVENGEVGAVWVKLCALGLVGKIAVD
jgi:hypothetical protein